LSDELPICVKNLFVLACLQLKLKVCGQKEDNAPNVGENRIGGASGATLSVGL
jgi:hypothetical protein